MGVRSSADIPLTSSEGRRDEGKDREKPAVRSYVSTTVDDRARHVLGFLGPRNRSATPLSAWGGRAAARTFCLLMGIRAVSTVRLRERYAE